MTVELSKLKLRLVDLLTTYYTNKLACNKFTTNRTDGDRALVYSITHASIAIGRHIRTTEIHRRRNCSSQLAFHDTDTDILADILARIVARMYACRCRRRGMPALTACRYKSTVARENWSREPNHAPFGGDLSSFCYAPVYTKFDRHMPRPI